MVETATSQIGFGPFETPTQPIEIGQLKSMTWRAPFTNGLTDLWRERCEGYWDRIEQRFGVVFSKRTYIWAEDAAIGPVVATYATPIAILKGERIPIGAIVRLDDDQPNTVQ